jgi:hypothetical protein
MLHFVRFETTTIASGESGCVPDLTFMAHRYLQPRQCRAEWSNTTIVPIIEDSYILEFLIISEAK